MPTIDRLRRSVLYLPASNARALEKARSLPVDSLILDLEDAVAPEAKVAARSALREACLAGGFGRREIALRVNGLGTPWGKDDVEALAGVGADAMLFPKIETAADVRAAEAAMIAAGAPETLQLWIMVETPKAILDLKAIAAASPRLTCLVAGTSDLGRDLRLRPRPDRLGLLGALSLLVAAARANGQDALDGVHLDLNDDAGLAEACRQGRDLGFDGKTLIHPKQIAAANAAFAPDEGDIAQARLIRAAWEEARASGKGIVLVNGRLVENLHAEEAARTLRLADAIRARETEDA